MTDEDKYVKIYFRKAKALMEMGQYIPAKECLEKAHKLAPKNQDVVQLIHENSKKQKGEEKNEKGSGFSFDGKKKNWTDVIKFLNDEEVLSSRIANISPSIELNKERGWIASADIEQFQTIMIDSGFTFPKDYCFDLIDYMNSDVKIKEQYLRLYPTNEYPMTKEAMTIDYKRALRALREGVKYG